MTGILAGCLTGLGIGVMVCGTVGALAVADTPAAAAVTAAFGLTALLGACLYLRDRWRSRRRRVSVPPARAAVLASAWTAVRGATVYAGDAAAGAVTVARVRVREARAARPVWTDDELDALDDLASLEQLLGETEAPHERRFR